MALTLEASNVPPSNLLSNLCLQQRSSMADMESCVPPGFRFHPSDEELITYYLINKISDSSFTGRAIADVDLNKCEPWDLPGTYLPVFIIDLQ